MNRIPPVALVLIGLAAAAVAADDGAGIDGDGSSASVGSAATEGLPADPDPAGVGYEVRWQTIDGGATSATGGDYQLRGTIGQPDADPGHPSESPDFAHAGGFWTLLPAASDVDGDLVFRDQFES